jgi:hypothetical protein
VFNLRVVGGDALAASLAVAARDLADMNEGFTRAAQIINGAQRSSAPRRTGRLAGAMTIHYEGSNSAMLTNPLVYAVPIHWGRPAHHIAANPYVMRAADRTEHMWTGALEEDAQRILNGVHGA